LPFTFDAAAVPFEGVNVMFATHPTNHEWSWLLNDCGARSRLMSYYIMMNKSDDELQQYVETGRLQDYVPNQRPKNSKSVHNHSEAVKNYMRLQVWERLKYYEQREEDNGASRTIGAVGDRGTSTVGQ
jgi:hypothetical protein